MNLMPHPYPAEKTRVIHVKGSDYDIGKGHVEQVGDAVGRGMPRFYFDFWKRLLSMNQNAGFDKAFFCIAKLFLERFLVRKLQTKIPEFAKERIRGVCESSGISYDDMILTLVLPDLLPMLQAYAVKLRPSMFIEVTPPLKFGCSSFVSSGKYFLNGRNLDFPGVAYWDRYPVIQVTEKKDCLRYIGFGSAGVPFAGITGVNEAQISVSLHQHYCRHTLLNGQLPFLISERILTQAKNISMALDILRQERVATAWAFIVTDGKTRDAFIYECHPKNRGIRYLNKDEALLSHTNYFQSVECQPGEYATTQRMNWDNHARNARIRDLVQATQGEMTPGQAVKVLSDHFDPFWKEEKYVNRIVSQVYNIQSLVMDTENMKAYIAEGDCPIHIRNYREYSLSDMLGGGTGETQHDLEGYRFQNQKKQAAKQHYILSFVAAFDGHVETAIQELTKALENDFCVEASMVGGVLRLKNRRYGQALGLFEKGKQWVEDQRKEKGLVTFPPEYFENCLFLARTYDLLGKRTQAVRMYQYVTGHKHLADANLRALARQQGPYNEKKLSRIIMPYSTYIPFE